MAMNPVKAGIVKRPEQYHWSSAAAYLFGKNDGLIRVDGLNERIDNWAAFFDQGVDSLLAEKIRKHERTGRPLGDKSFVAKLEKMLERMLMPQKAGRKPSSKIQNVTAN